MGLSPALSNASRVSSAMTRGAIDLYEVAPPEILDPRRTEGEHSRVAVCSCNVLSSLTGVVASTTNAPGDRSGSAEA